MLESTQENSGGEGGVTAPKTGAQVPIDPHLTGIIFRLICKKGETAEAVHIGNII